MCCCLMFGYKRKVLWNHMKSLCSYVSDPKKMCWSLRSDPEISGRILGSWNMFSSNDRNQLETSGNLKSNWSNVYRRPFLYLLQKHFCPYRCMGGTVESGRKSVPVGFPQVQPPESIKILPEEERTLLGVTWRLEMRIVNVGNLQRKT